LVDVLLFVAKEQNGEDDWGMNESIREGTSEKMGGENGWENE